MKFTQLILSLFIAVSALRAAAAEDLEQQAEREAKWKKITLELPGMQAEAAAYTTENGGIRLIALPEKQTSALKISGRDGLFRYVRNGAKAAKVCKDLASTLDYELESNNRFQFEVFVNALRALTLETQIHEVKAEAILAYVNGSSPLMTPARLKKLQAELNSLASAKQDEVRKSGILKIDWQGVDDLVCDLLSGNAELKVRLTVSFDAAELRRKEVLSARQVQDLAERLSSMPVSEQSAVSRAVSRAANLGVILQSQLGAGYPAFTQNKLHKLYPQILNPTDGQVLAVTADTAAKIARRLDDLSRGRDINTSLISAPAEWDYKSGW